MDRSLKLISLNIDGRDNLDRVLPFLEKKRPDIAFLQEICEIDLKRFEYLFPGRLYVPMTRYERKGTRLSVGFALFHGASVRIRSTAIKYYVGNEGHIPNLDETSADSRHATMKRAIVLCEPEKDGMRYRIGATHFTWAPDKNPTEHQRNDMRRLLRIIKQSGKLVLCGDINAPRGGEIFGMVAERLKDNVPRRYKTSIDPELHRVRGLRAMVDGLFSTPGYDVSDVKLTFRLSDHAALSGVIRKRA